ncbi:alpha/beta hydrolase [bacterium LRH843]|nr:alpha/beta hydrolase [bacterium LRH843]
MTQVTIRDLCLSYDHFGSGEPLLLIHGLGERKEGWTCQHELANKFELIIPDLRGHGESKQYDNITIDTFALDLLALLDYLNIEKAHICGLSMGGFVAQEIYRIAPERCRSLILASTAHYAPKIMAKWVYHIRMWRYEKLTKEQEKLISARTCLYSWNDENMQKFNKFHSPNRESYRPSLEACLQIDNRKLLKSIHVPTLITGGQYDTIIPIWVQILMHKMIPNSKLVIFKDAGHIARLEKAEEFNQVLTQFLTDMNEQSA